MCNNRQLWLDLMHLNICSTPPATQPAQPSSKQRPSFRVSHKPIDLSGGRFGPDHALIRLSGHWTGDCCVKNEEHPRQNLSNELPCNPLSNKPEERNVGIIVFFRYTKCGECGECKPEQLRGGGLLDTLHVVDGITINDVGGRPRVICSMWCKGEHSKETRRQAAAGILNQSTCTTIEQAMRKLRVSMSLRSTPAALSRSC